MCYNICKIISEKTFVMVEIGEREMYDIFLHSSRYFPFAFIVVFSLHTASTTFGGSFNFYTYDRVNRGEKMKMKISTFLLASTMMISTL
jgi:hypothetical protein